MNDILPTEFGLVSNEHPKCEDSVNDEEDHLPKESSAQEVNAYPIIVPKVFNSLCTREDSAVCVVRIQILAAIPDITEDDYGETDAKKGN